MMAWSTSGSRSRSMFGIEFGGGGAGASASADGSTVTAAAEAIACGVATARGVGMGAGTDARADFITKGTGAIGLSVEIEAGPGVPSTISVSSALTVSAVCVTRTARGGGTKEGEFRSGSVSGRTVALRRGFGDALAGMLATAVELLSLALSAITVSIAI